MSEDPDSFTTVTPGRGKKTNIVTWMTKLSLILGIVLRLLREIVRRLPAITTFWQRRISLLNKSSVARCCQSELVGQRKIVECLEMKFVVLLLSLSLNNT